MNFLNGYKTYVVIGLFAVVFVVGLLLPEGQIVPEWIWGILAALGLGAVRAALQDVSGNAGWKTYLAAAIVLGVSLVTALGIPITPGVLEIIYTISGTLGLVGIRDAISELRPQQ